MSEIEQIPIALNHAEVLRIGYMGSINSIIDIDKIIEILIKIRKHKHVKVLIVGDGEKRNSFLKELRNNKIECIYYGKVFDIAEKQNIF